MNVRTKPIQPSQSQLWWSRLFAAAAFGAGGYLANFPADGIIACIIVLFGTPFFRDWHAQNLSQCCAASKTVRPTGCSSI
jgi:hypothetical protein